jgi:chemotaxis protein MotB
MANQQPIIIKRNKRHAGHHGGAWKVAYADFVTALMALFIVLWLMSTSDNVKKAVAGYFNDPSGKSNQTGTDHAGSADLLPLTKDNIEHLKEQLEQQIQNDADLKTLSKQIEITVTPEGLRIELLESSTHTFFESGSTQLNANGQELLELLARQIGSLPNKISIEGHTDSKPYTGEQSYTNWELSVDRANSARRLMQQRGLRQDQVSQVRGYADQRLRIPDKPEDPSNRRISLIVQYLQADPNAKPGQPSGTDALAKGSEPGKTNAGKGEVAR